MFTIVVLSLYDRHGCQVFGADLTYDVAVGSRSATVPARCRVAACSRMVVGDYLHLIVFNCGSLYIHSDFNVWWKEDVWGLCLVEQRRPPTLRT